MIHFSVYNNFPSTLLEVLESEKIQSKSFNVEFISSGYLIQTSCQGSFVLQWAKNNVYVSANSKPHTPATCLKNTLKLRKKTFFFLSKIDDYKKLIKPRVERVVTSE